MHRTLLFIISILNCPFVFADINITPSEVYAKALLLEQETLILKQHLQITDTPTTERIIKQVLYPRHVWQKTYFISLKISNFRKQHQFPILNSNSLEPVLSIDPILPYEQIQRLLTEVRILKQRLGISAIATKVKQQHSKTPTDVFNKLHTISLCWDTINRQEVSSNIVFAELMRLYDDVNILLAWLKIEDNTYPPEKVKSTTPYNTLQSTFELMRELQRLQQSVGLPRAEFIGFLETQQVIAADVLNMVGMNLAETQIIKAHLGLKHKLTPPAEFFSNKRPADVYQLMRWIIRKLRLIQHL